MDTFAVASLAFSVLALLYWGTQLGIVVRVARSVVRLHRLPEPARALWPRVSAILTARDEAAALEEAVRARLDDDYPDLEIVLVDDRSIDETPRIADCLASSDLRVRVEHIQELPDGWLGKLHALDRGVRRASGEWLLFSDGDVAVRRGALRRAVDHAERHGFDHVAVMPRCRPVNPLLDALTSVFLRLITLNLRVWAIEDPRSRAAIGIGAFNLVRRSALERTPGFAWLRMEVADDVTLGQMLKATGARSTVLLGPTLVDLVFHSSLRDALVSAERGTFTAVGGFSLARLVALAVATVVLEGSPVVALALAREPGPLAAALGVGGVALAAQAASDRLHHRSLAWLPLVPLASLISACGMLRAGILGVARGGIVWRGTFHPTAALRAGQRFGTAFDVLRPPAS